jgi:tRNA threonylcarbamoyladenosine biosynthesis protein TsaB
VRRVLAVDTSSWWGGAALVERDAAGTLATVAEIGVHVHHTHAVRLLGWADLLLAEAGWTRSDLDGYAASVGPGSFTGIRVGLGFLRGLAIATSRPCFGVTTLEAVAHAHGPAEADRVVVLDAGRGQIYVGRFDAAGDPPVERLEPRACPRDELPLDLVRGAAVVIPGPGTSLPDALPSGPRRASAPSSVAAAVGRLALARARAGAPDTGLAPLYLRPPDVRGPGG